MLDKHNELKCKVPMNTDLIAKLLKSQGIFVISELYLAGLFSKFSLGSHGADAGWDAFGPR